MHIQSENSFSKNCIINKKQTLKRAGAAFSSVLFLALSLGLTGCQRSRRNEEAFLSTVAPISGDESVTVPTSHADSSRRDIDTYIILNDKNTTINGSGASFSESVLTISKGGSYYIKGSLSEGQIKIDSEDDKEIVRLHLAGVYIHCSTDSPLLVEASKNKTVLIPAEKTENELYSSGDSSKSAAIFSEDDLAVAGDGILTVRSSSSKGIFSKKSIQIKGSVLNIKSADDAICAKDGISVSGGIIAADCKRIGLHADSDSGILISGGNFKITSGLSCLLSEESITVSGGSFDLTSAGGWTQKTTTPSGSELSPNDFPKLETPAVSEEEGEKDFDGARSTKAVKAENSISISGGSFGISSLDDAFFCEDSLSVSGGSFSVKTNGEAFHSDSLILVNGGELSAESCREGFKGKTVLISGGEIYISAEDNAVSSKNGVFQSGGNVNIFSSQSTQSTSERSVGSYSFTAGTLFAAGNNGETPNVNAKRGASLEISSAFSANTLFTVTDENDRPLFSVTLPKSCNDIRIASQTLISGRTYKIYTGGSNSGIQKNGIYSDSSFTPGLLVKNVVAK